MKKSEFANTRQRDEERAEKVKKLVCEGLRTFLDQDAEELLRFNPNEETISAKIAMYIHCLMQRNSFPNDIHVDCEYNKANDNPKEGPKNYLSASMRPDIIIHQRGTNRHNILYCEIKKGAPSKNDIKKVNFALKKDGLYRYQLGLLIHHITANSLRVRWVEPGQQAGRKTLDEELPRGQK